MRGIHIEKVISGNFYYVVKSNVIPNQLADTWARSVSSPRARRGAARLLQPGGEGKAWGGSDRSCPKMHPAEHLGGGGVIVIALCCFQMMGNGWDPEPQLTGGVVAVTCGEVRCAVPCCAVPWALLGRCCPDGCVPGPCCRDAWGQS